jgi:hypothetical protein
MALVVQIQPVRGEYWDRLYISIGAGANYTKASDVAQLNIDGNADYKGRVYFWGLNANTNITDRGNEAQILRRHDYGVYGARILNGRLIAALNTGWQRNDELGLRSRVLGGAGLGYYLLTTGHHELLVRAGLSVNREWSRADSPAVNNLEGKFGTDFRMYFFDSPKTDLKIGINLMPNLTTAGRVRFELDVAGRQELAKDLFVELKYYESRDNQPPDGANAKYDRGVVLSVGWSKY